MAQKINPNTYRLGITLPWASRWFFTRKSRYFLEEDHAIRVFIRGKIKDAGIAGLSIERTSDVVRVNIQAARPGLIIGRGGKGIEELRESLLKIVKKLRIENKVPLIFSFNLNVEELKRTDVSAGVLAQQIATDLEKRQPYRKLMKRAIESTMQNRDVKGIKIKLSGRLNGAEISRVDWLAKGRMPLQTLRAIIDYAEATSFNSYGTIGVKVWIYKGEVFDEKRASRK
ncbi:MAG: 30S ribosomal protein S3 [Candidatus Paceibacterota bacterium]|jgi:small subunit ribosomal protein S3